MDNGGGLGSWIDLGVFGSGGDLCTPPFAGHRTRKTTNTTTELGEERRMLFLRTHILGLVSASPAGAGGWARQEDRKSTVHPPPNGQSQGGRWCASRANDGAFAFLQRADRFQEGPSPALCCLILNRFDLRGYVLIHRFERTVQQGCDDRQEG